MVRTAIDGQGVMVTLLLKRGSASRSSGQWRDDDFDVLKNGVVVGRIFFLDAVGPQGRPWMWASGHNGEIRRAAHGEVRSNVSSWAVVGGGQQHFREGKPEAPWRS